MKQYHEDELSAIEYRMQEMYIRFFVRFLYLYGEDDAFDAGSSYQELFEWAKVAGLSIKILDGYPKREATAIITVSL